MTPIKSKSPKEPIKRKMLYIPTSLFERAKATAYRMGYWKLNEFLVECIRATVEELEKTKPPSSK